MLSVGANLSFTLTDAIQNGARCEIKILELSNIITLLAHHAKLNLYFIDKKDGLLLQQPKVWEMTQSGPEECRA